MRIRKLFAGSFATTRFIPGVRAASGLSGVTPTRFPYDEPLVSTNAPARSLELWQPLLKQFGSKIWACTSLNDGPAGVVGVDVGDGVAVEVGVPVTVGVSVCGRVPVTVGGMVGVIVGDSVGAGVNVTVAVGVLVAGTGAAGPSPAHPFSAINAAILIRPNERRGMARSDR